ncbi:hypothetical protein AAULR_09650 [Lacticaseibacillus rhamnosus MTCC 5462]|nr:hypothetical protein AAULR_09650 [Lacticaseibacillus rhamnosus MTCC 5462]
MDVATIGTGNKIVPTVASERNQSMRITVYFDEWCHDDA